MTFLYSMIRLLVPFNLFLMLNISVSEAANILAVGDSMTEFMGQILESLCADSTVQNAGIGGTTAEQWASYTSDDLNGCGTNWDVVHISVGGNDLLESGCTISTEDLTSRMESAVTNIVKNLAPGVSKYVVTGYCMPHTPEEEGGDSGCSAPSSFAPLSDAIRAISLDNIDLPSSATLEIVDSIDVCGGSLNSFSDPTYFQDPIHLNAKGYCQFFSRPAVQTALTCSSSPGYDCDLFGSAEIPGLDQNCLSGGDDSSAHSRLLSSSVCAFIIIACVFVV